MLSRLSSKHRLFLMGLGALFLLLVGYQLSIKKTLSLYQENTALEELNTRGEQELLQEIAFRSRDKGRIDSVRQVWEQHATEAILMKGIFRISAHYGVSVEEFNETGSESHQIVLQGGFINLTKVVKAISHELSAAKVQTLNMYTEVDRRTKEERLLMKLTVTRNMP